MREIPLANGKGIALVDDADFELVSQYRWHAHPNGRNVYAARAWREGGAQRIQFMHTLIAGYVETDHVDHNGCHNYRANLRPATKRQNAANQRKRAGSSRYKGVSWNRAHSAWMAYITVDYRQRHLGYFADEADAARRYDDEARAAWDDRACLNFPR